MKRTGIAELPLHHGRAPRWLFERMKRLGGCIFEVMVEEYGQREVLKRLSNPHWFQALGCVLGFDWHSSGLTTTVCGALKEVISPENHGMAVAGGKGKAALKAKEEIFKLGETLSLPDSKVEKLVYASRMSAKVDNAAIQAGYKLYHHAFFFSERGSWVVVQQGMNASDKTARRYHWLSENVKSFVEEPHSAIVCDVKREFALDMTSRESRECRKVSLDLVKEGPERVKRDMLSLRHLGQRSLYEWFKGKKNKGIDVLVMPRNVNWDALKKAYEFQPKNYEELIGIKGIGASAVRGLALVSELIYGKPPSWKDPARFSFAYGGKDGVPRPVDKHAMDESIKFLKGVIEQARLGRKERLNALKRLISLAR